MEGMMMTVVAAATPSPAAVVVAAAPAVPVFKQPQPVNPNSLPFFSRISEDILVNVFSRLEDDPRDLAKLACVCRRFTNVIRTSCWRHQCMRVVPTIVSELMQSSSQPELLGEPPCGWGSLQKLLVCCPGLRHAGVLLEFGDYGLEREIGKSTDYKIVRKEKLGEDPTNAPAPLLLGKVGAAAAASDDVKDVDPKVIVHGRPESEEKMELILGLQGSEMMIEKIKKKKAAEISGLEASESAAAIVVGSGALCLHEDSGSKDKALGGDYSDAENLLSLLKRRKTEGNREGPVKQMKKGGLHYHNKMMKDSRIVGSYGRHVAATGEEGGGGGGGVLRTQRSLEWHHLPRDNCGDENSARMMTIDIDINCKHEDPHLAKGIRILTREQGNKLLASRFRADSLYICDWPGCVHPGEKRMYKLFRGIFKNFKHSHVWRNLRDLQAKKSELSCAFCSSFSTWDMVTTFCLRHSLEYHEDGEPVVRAYVCENGHVAGAWTDRPVYNL